MRPTALVLVLLAWLQVTFATNCECIGDNSKIPRKQKKFANTNYGNWCADWDMDHRYCNKRGIKEANRSCWCPAKWCYVQKGCDTAIESSMFPYTDLYYSYAVCGETDAQACFATDENEGDFEVDMILQDENMRGDWQYWRTQYRLDYYFGGGMDAEHKLDTKVVYYLGKREDLPLCVITSCMDVTMDERRLQGWDDVVDNWGNDNWGEPNYDAPVADNIKIDYRMSDKCALRLQQLEWRLDVADDKTEAIVSCYKQTVNKDFEWELNNRGRRLINRDEITQQEERLDIRELKEELRKLTEKISRLEN